MTKPSDKLTSLPIIIILMTLAACGGGGGGGTPPPVSSGTTVSGTATAPGGTVSMLPTESGMLAILDYFVSAAKAAITGVTPVANATVELIRIDDSGNKVGVTLASTTTDASGNYSLELPSGETFSGDLVVQILGATETLRAIVSGSSVDIDPISEIVLNRTISAGADLSALNLSSIESMIAQLKALDIDLSATTITAAIAEIETEAPEIIEFMDDQIALADTIVDDGTAAASAIGNWHLLEFNIALYDTENQTSGSFAALSLASTDPLLSITSSSPGSMTITNPGESVIFAEYRFDIGLPQFFFETGSEIGGETEPAIISSDGVINITTAQELDMDPGDSVAWLYAPQTVRVFPAGENLYITLNNASADRFQALDTDSDGLTDNINQNAKLGDEEEASLTLMIKEGSNMSSADLNGDYGWVSLYYDFEGDGITQLLEGVVGQFTLSNGTETAEVDSYQGITIFRTANSSTSMPVTVEEFTGPQSTRIRNWTLAPNGVATYTAPAVGGEAGFSIVGRASADGSLLAFLGVDIASATRFSQEVYMALRLGSNMSSALNNQTYRLFAIDQDYRDDGGTKIAMTKSGFITFSADSSLANLSEFEDIEISRSNAVGGLTRSLVTVPAETNLPATVATNGRITLPGLDGFVSADGNLLIMRTHDNEVTTQGFATMGLVIGIKLN